MTLQDLAVNKLKMANTTICAKHCNTFFYRQKNQYNLYNYFLNNILAGTPTAIELSGISISTTEFAPIMQSFPMVILPRILAPVEITQLSPIIGCSFTPLSVSLFPNVTPLNILQFLPITTSLPITISCPCIKHISPGIFALHEISLAKKILIKYSKNKLKKFPQKEPSKIFVLESLEFSFAYCD